MSYNPNKAKGARLSSVPSDSLLGRFNEQKKTLIDALGPLYDLFEGEGVELGGIKSKVDLRSRDLSFYKKFGERSRFDFKIRPETKEWKLGYSFDID
jgi:hypothetical protein|tara:strand:- start:141 stop:431 length:291 start_codon:yes stop_codon:yes gene_type:complete